MARNRPSRGLDTRGGGPTIARLRERDRSPTPMGGAGLGRIVSRNEGRGAGVQSRFRPGVVLLAVLSVPGLVPLKAMPRGQDPSDRPARGPDLAAVVRQVIERTNDFRREQKLEPVRPDEKLLAAARDFAA